MFLIFNKEFREMEKFVSTLIKKAKESTKIELKIEGNDTIYKLDSIDIVFKTISPQTLKVRDKSGTEIISVNCEYTYDANPLQRAKSHQFSNLLEHISKIHDERIKKVKKMKEAVKEAQKRNAEQQNAKKLEQTKLQMLANANERLRNL